MRITRRLATLLLTLAMAACSGIETRHTEVETFTAGNYKYYKWRTKPLENTANSQDPVYVMDTILRREVDAGMSAKGYVLDQANAQFTVDYISAGGLRMGQRSEQAYNIHPYPTVTPNRQANQAVVDNAYALGGIKETSNIALQFNDVNTNQEVWQVIITKIVENVNKVDLDEMKKGLKKGVNQALAPLPDAR